jgi:translation initiation factor 2B subunit (eIF-2B alpha/beta/delta family)
MTHHTNAEALSSLFLETERLIGSRDTCFLAMNSLKESIDSFKGTQNELHHEIRSLTKAVTEMSPRIALLIVMMFTILDQYETDRVQCTSLSQEKELLFACIDAVVEKRKKSVEKLLRYSEEIVSDGDTILLHDLSHTVFDILVHAQRQHKKFDVFIAAQEEKQTNIIVQFLHEHHIEFTVIPEFLLAHVMDSITKVLLGAVTINSNKQIISDAGSEAIVSQMQHFGKPVYVPITTDKFSLWQAAEKHHTLKAVHGKTCDGIRYDKLTFSHDRYSVMQVTKFITNKGCLSAEELSEMYDAYYAKNSAWREKVGV